MKVITLNNLHEATEQEVFDQVALHLLTQNKKSMCTVLGNTACVLRGNDNLKCAAGCLISDEEYKHFELYKYEKATWYNLANLLYNFQAIKKCDIRVHELIRRLQVLHDSERVADWRYALLQVADAFKLNNAVVITYERK